jgi:hypothetical protein
MFMPNEISCLIYVSQAAPELNPNALQDILSVSVKRNGSAGLRGLLLYSAGSFIQYLEGPPDALGRLMDRIKRDPRHHDVEVLYQDRVPQYLFPTWNMGGLDLSARRELDRERLRELLQMLSAGERRQYNVQAAEKIQRILIEFRSQLAAPEG